MKITQFRRNGDATALSVMDLDILVNKIKTEIKDSLSDYLWKKMKRNPMILPIIMEVE